MMAFDSALVVIMVEALAVLILLAVALFFISRNKRKKEISAIDSFISKLDEQASLKNLPLEKLLSDNCGLDRNTIAAALQEITDSERALFQKVIQLFLKREMDLLGEIEQSIGNLSEPYCSLLVRMASGSATISPENTKSIGLERVNQQLMRQLDTAMKTIDELTSEYTRVFSGNQTALELENSSKKMMQIFQDTEHSIKQQMQR